jgi:hypothetical protein
MTADDVVEAMARGIHEANPGVYGPWSQIIRAAAEGNKLAERTATLRRNEARAAIRAVTERGGLMVGKMPGGRVVATANSERWQAYYEGHNEALAAVRANAVKVEGV